MLKNIIAIGLIGGATVFAALIFFTGSRGIITIQENPSNSIAQIKNESVPTLKTNKIQVENSTEILANDLTQALSQASTGLDSLDPGSLAEKLLDNGLNNFDPSKIIPEVNREDIKITTASDKIATGNYFKNLFAIIENNLGELDADFSRPSLEDLSLYAKAYEKTISQLYQLIVPQVLADIHREEIRLLTARQNIFNNLVDYKNDPVLAMVSGNLLKTVDGEFGKVIQAQIKFIKENGIEI